MNRRTAIKGAVLGTIAPLFAVSGRPASDFPADPGVRIIISPDYMPPVYGQKGKDYIYRLGRATLAFMHDRFDGREMPLWGKKPAQVDLEKRIVNIAYWIGKGTAEFQHVYPLDPAWIMAQIMAESLFYEFAVSWAFAVGVCQFISPTAKGYGLVCADDNNLAQSDLKLAHLSGNLDEYYALQDRIRKLRRSSRIFSEEDEVLYEALSALNKGDRARWADHYLQILDKEKKLVRLKNQVRDNYTRFLNANFKNRSIFNQDDLKFLMRFDQRVTYAAPIRAMCKMMATHLKLRRGNILTATAGYNAGLGNTKVDSHIYGPYGIIPSFEQTVTYVSRIAIHHHEIVSRM
ncbi:MAG: transglycosylase SLT domain-containing protein [Desulfovibrionales bacterium]